MTWASYDCRTLGNAKALSSRGYLDHFILDVDERCFWGKRCQFLIVNLIRLKKTVKKMRVDWIGFLRWWVVDRITIIASMLQCLLEFLQYIFEF